MSSNSKTVEGIYRNGRVELLERTSNADGARVLVTFLPEGEVTLVKYGIDEEQAAGLSARLSPFIDDWDLPEMRAYDSL